MRIDVTQAEQLFLLASAKLGAHYRHARGDKVITGLGGAGVLCQAIFSDVVPGERCELTVWADAAGRGLAGRPFLRQVFHTAFDEWGVTRVSTVVRESNKTSQAAVLALGFEFEAPLASWYGHEDGWMFRMLRRDCRWLKH